MYGRTDRETEEAEVNVQTRLDGLGFVWHGDRRQDLATPWPLFNELSRRYGHGGFDLDVCASGWSHKCECYLDVDDDGLSISWALVEGRPSRAFCNPPYDSIEPWLLKGREELLAGRAEVVCFLIPNRSDRPWYQPMCDFASRVVPIIGRVAFDYPPEVEKKNQPYEASIAVVYEHPIVSSEYRGSRR